jgi:cell division protein FtsB
VRLLTLALVALLVLIQWPLWFGKGGWFRVAELQRELDSQRQSNLVIAQRNAALAAEVRSFREGREAVEERARTELHMLREDELFFQILPNRGAAQEKDAPRDAATPSGR